MIKHKHQISALFSVIFLSALLLVAPCKVRNFIEYALHVPQTDVLNKAQVTHHDDSCSVVSDQVICKNNRIPNVQHQTDAIVPAFINLKFAFFKIVDTILLPKATVSHVISIPLYILYQTITVYF